MLVSLIIPIFTVPEGAQHQKIIEEVKRITGFTQIKLFCIENKQHKKEEDAQFGKQIIVESSDLNINFGQLAQILPRISELQRQNQLLQKDLSDFYQLYEETKFKAQSKSGQIHVSRDSSKQDVLHHSEEHMEDSLQSKDLQKQIQKLVSEKISKDETISKLTAYCEFLVKIIEAKKLAII